MKTRTAFIIIAYHPKESDLAGLFESLPKRDAIIVDNGQSLIKDAIGAATLLTQSENLGFGAAANIGMRYAIGQGYDWFVLLNQDVSVSSHAVSQLIDTLSSLEPCVAGPFAGILDPKRWTTKLGLMARIGSGELRYLSGSCLAIHSKVIERAGYFYEPYFLYYEEADYCMRAKSKGFPLRHLDIAGFRHEESESLGHGSVAHQYYLSRNHLLFIERQAPYDVKAHEYLRLPKTIAEHIARREQGALMGVRDYFLRRFGKQGRVK